MKESGHAQLQGRPTINTISGQAKENGEENMLAVLEPRTSQTQFQGVTTTPKALYIVEAFRWMQRQCRKTDDSFQRHHAAFILPANKHTSTFSEYYCVE